jgi:hypothetical protein
MRSGDRPTRGLPIARHTFWMAMLSSKCSVNGQRTPAESPPRLGWTILKSDLWNGTIGNGPLPWLIGLRSNGVSRRTSRRNSWGNPRGKPSVAPNVAVLSCENGQVA